jgi:hypothetical protein
MQFTLLGSQFSVRVHVRAVREPNKEGEHERRREKVEA